MIEAGVVTYPMSRATIGWGRCARILFGAILVAIFMFDNTNDRWIWLAITWVFFAFAILNCGGAIELSPDGVRSRNIFTDRWYPWSAVDRFEATDRVEIVQTDGRTSRCWAVQRANISSMLNMVSRVDTVVDELNNIRQVTEVVKDNAVLPTVRRVRLTVWEWVQLVLLLPILATIGGLIRMLI